ncbi:MAG: hypothetical protein SP1CHLAM54_11670 [Chlamydiia bacterium]|nr:hypothetical protein [Chlamydiia bacterium]MCH9616070.1 hypothetical protein [Chlamydiia bacterium]MCH9629093.1 hypothetical protein [Chlamydiia bacterium]
MKSHAERLFIEEVLHSSKQLQKVTKGLAIGTLIKSIRSQLGMSQQTLASKTQIPQSTISRIERGGTDANLSTLQKLLQGLSCDLVIAPAMTSSIDNLRKEQAMKIANKRLDYLVGTMNLEMQALDKKFINNLLEEEVERLLKGPKSKLWEN